MKYRSDVSQIQVIDSVAQGRNVLDDFLRGGSVIRHWSSIVEVFEWDSGFLNFSSTSSASDALLLGRYVLRILMFLWKIDPFIIK